jgi:pilus assembly protein CpaE
VPLSILLLDTDRAAADAVRTALAKAGNEVTVVTDPLAVADQAASHSLVVIDVVPEGVTPEGLIADVRSNARTASVPILCIAQADDLEYRIRLLEAGADDVISKPFDQLELEARVEALSLRAQRSQKAVSPLAIGSETGSRIVSVFSPKGGVGTTTIAVNLAILQAERDPEGVLLLDLDLQFGQVATHLNIEIRQSVLELARDQSALNEPELLRTYAVRHETGVSVIAAPPSPGYAPLISPEQIDSIIEQASAAFRTVIIDAGSALDERALAVFARSDTVILPVVPEIPALNAVHAMLDHLSETGSVGARTMFVLNNVFPRGLLRMPDIEKALGGRIVLDLPHDPTAYLKAANVGVPLVLGSPKSPPAAQLRRLAAEVFGAAPTDAGNGSSPAPAKKRGLGLLRRG